MKQLPYMTGKRRSVEGGTGHITVKSMGKNKMGEPCVFLCVRLTIPLPRGAEAGHVWGGYNRAHEPKFYVIQSCRGPVL